MPQPTKVRASKRSVRAASTRNAPSGGSRFTVGLAPSVAEQVQRYAKANDSRISKAISALVRIGLDGQQQRKREFFKKLKAKLASSDPNREDELVHEFRSLILGR